MVGFESALIAGAVFGVSPAVLQSSPVPAYAILFPLPFILKYCVNLISNPSKRNVIGLLLSLFVQGLLSTQILVIALASGGILMLTDMAFKRSEIRLKGIFKTAGAVLFAGIGAAVALIPFYYPMLKLMQYGTITPRPGISCQIANSADLLSVFDPTGRMLTHPPVVVGVGLLLILCSLLTLRSPQTKIAWANFLLISALALGPLLKFADHCLFVPGPYAVLMLLPGFNVMRAPERFLIAAALFAGLLAAIGFAQLLAKFDRLNSSRLRWILAGGVALIVVAQNGMWSAKYSSEVVSQDNMPLVYKWLAKQPANTVCLEYPDQNDRDALLASTFHWRRLVNGHSSFWPRIAYPYEARIFNELPSRFGFADLEALGVNFFISRRPNVSAQQWNTLQAVADQHKGFLVGDALVIPIKPAQLSKINGAQILWSLSDAPLQLPPGAKVNISAAINLAGTFRDDHYGEGQKMPLKWTDSSGNARVLQARLFMPAAAAHNSAEPVELIATTPSIEGAFDVSSCTGDLVHFRANVAHRQSDERMGAELSVDAGHEADAGLATRFLVDVNNTGEQQFPQTVAIKLDWKALLKRENWRSRQNLLNSFVHRQGTVMASVEWLSDKDGHSALTEEEPFQLTLLPNQRLPEVFYFKAPETPGTYRVKLNLSIADRNSDDKGMTTSEAKPLATCNVGLVSVK
jgi:hypothetical protein